MLLAIASASVSAASAFRSVEGDHVAIRSLEGDSAGMDPKASDATDVEEATDGDEDDEQAPPAQGIEWMTVFMSLGGGIAFFL